MRKDTLHRMAREYLEAGLWPCPCKPNTKGPRVDGWPDLRLKTEDIPRLFPEGNEGLALIMSKAAGFFALDVEHPDKGHGDGLACLAALEEKHGKLPPTPSAATPGGGRHFIFKYPPGRTLYHGFPDKVTFPGLEVVSKGNVMAEPSEGKNGKPYKWRTPPTEAPPAEAPAWLLDIITEDGKKAEKEATRPTSGGGPEAWPALAKLKALPRAKLANDGWWAACCPAHEDQNPSFGFKETGGALALTCRAGCEKEAILKALDLTEADLRRPSSAPPRLESLEIFGGLADMVAEARRLSEERKLHGPGIIGIPTPWKRLNDLLGGWRPGLHLLAAEPGRGKTTLALQAAAEASKAGFPAVFVSFEEAPARLLLKATCAGAGLKMKHFEEGLGDLNQLEEAATQATANLQNLHLVSGDMKTTTGQVVDLARRLKEAAGKRVFVVVDYLQRWATSRRDFSEFRHDIDALTGELRDAALLLDSPFLVISSQNRTGQGSAQLVSFKESSGLEYSGDTCLFLVDAEEERYHAEPPALALRLEVKKNRFGPVGGVDLIFRPDVGTFREVAR